MPLTRAPETSLRKVRAGIPASCYDKSALRATVAVVQAALLYLVPLTGLALTDRWWLLVPLWLLTGFAVSGLFVLGHDASHRALVASNRTNKWLAHLLMFPSAHVEAAWDLGHNRVHHGFTTRQGLDFVWHPITVEEYQTFSGPQRMRHQLEWSWMGSGLYYIRAVWWQKMMRFPTADRKRIAIKTDRAAVVGAAAVILVGTFVVGLNGGLIHALWLPVKLWVLPFLVFTQIIGWTVYMHHVSPDIRWWTHSDWNQFRGQMESTTILTMPAWANRLWFHNIFVHVPHHVDARIPFHQLPAAAQALVRLHPDVIRMKRFTPTDYWRATKACKLYDFELGRWLPYSAASATARRGLVSRG